MGQANSTDGTIESLLMQKVGPHAPMPFTKRAMEMGELVAIIGQYLSTDDLCRGVRVCRLFHAVLTPLIWHTFDDTVEPWGLILETATRHSPYALQLASECQFSYDSLKRGWDETWVRSIISKNARYIRHLRTQWPLTVEACVASGECIHLKSVAFFSIIDIYSLAEKRETSASRAPWDQWVPDVPPTFFDLDHPLSDPTISSGPYNIYTQRSLRFLWQLLLQNPNLEEIVYPQVARFKKRTFMPPLPFMQTVLERLVNLRHLERLPLNDHELSILAPSMQRLQYFTPGQIQERPSRVDSVSVAGIRQLNRAGIQLRYLQLPQEFSPISQAAVLEAMPGIEELYVGMDSLYETRDMPESVHLDADSLRVWSLPNALYLIHPMVTHSTANLQELHLGKLHSGVPGLVHLLGQISSPKLQVLQVGHLAPNAIYLEDPIVPTLPLSVDMNILPTFNLRHLRILGVCRPHDLFAPFRDPCEEIEEESESLTNGSAWWKCLPHLVEFQARYASPSTLIAIADNCPQLEILNVSLAQRGTKAIAHVLRTCSRLKSFVGKGHMIDANEEAVQDLDWVCSDLERLDLEVCGIPREREATEKRMSKDAKELSTKMYMRLGKLTKLRELNLGGTMPLKSRLIYTTAGIGRELSVDFQNAEVRHPYMTDSLELSMDSGLAYLGTLTCLERIGIRELDQRISQEELKWMKKHWPRLRSWVGFKSSLKGAHHGERAMTTKGSPFVCRNQELRHRVQETWPAIKLDKQDLAPLPLVFDDSLRNGSKAFSFTRALGALAFTGSFRWICHSTGQEATRAWNRFLQAIESMREDYHTQKTVLSRTQILAPVPLRELHLVGALHPGTIYAILERLPALTSLRVQIQFTASTSLQMDRILRACPTLVSLYLESTGHELTLARYETQLSEMNLDQEDKDLAVETHRGDLDLKLKSLIIKLARVDARMLMDMLAACPHLQELALIALLDPTPFPRDDVPWRTLTYETLPLFLPKACPHLTKLHYSIHESRLSEASYHHLLTAHPHVTEWSFQLVKLEPTFPRQIFHVCNVITSLELTLYKNFCTDYAVYPVTSRIKRIYRATLMYLHAFLCSAPHLLHLKTSMVHFPIEDLDPFPVALQAATFEPKVKLDFLLLNSSITDPVKPPQVWACRRLRTLSMLFSHAYSCNATLDPPASRLIFGYLGRVCPLLTHLYLGLGDVQLDLAGGLCLLSRLEFLEELSLEVPAFVRRWGSQVWKDSMDFSWMGQFPLPIGKVNGRNKTFKSWENKMKEEKRMIRRREKFRRHQLQHMYQSSNDTSKAHFTPSPGGDDDDDDNNNSGCGDGAQNVQGHDSLSLGLDIVHPLSHLGTLTDVREWLDAMDAKGHGYQCWPHLQKICLEDTNEFKGRTVFVASIHAVRPNVAKWT
ncbi:hypothetical protein BGZ94_005921 [Podila epigama]|nr:hypothetical protein BGZ94_005921 [Podila epigama]